MDELRELFAYYDFDGDGVITKTDVASFFEQIGNSDEAQIDKMYNQVGDLDFDKFAALIEKKEKSSLKQVFDLIDTDQDGQVKQKDLNNFIELFGGSYALGLCSDEDANFNDITKEVMAYGDTQRRGFLEFADFENALITSDRASRASRASSQDCDGGLLNSARG